MEIVYALQNSKDIVEFNLGVKNTQITLHVYFK